MRTDSPIGVVGGYLCTDLAEVTTDLRALESSGFWVVVIPYDWSSSGSGPSAVCARFRSVRPAVPWPGPRWIGPSTDSWSSSLDRPAFEAGVKDIRELIAAGSVYQVNLTRRLSAPLQDGHSDIAALGAALAQGNPAPFSAVVRLPEQGVHVASASPELYLARRGDMVRSSPIKGTAPTADLLTPKDNAENVMIADLVRNDLGRVCKWGSVRVPSLLAVEPHPGLVHLVSTVEGRLRPEVTWADVIEATFPPGSITGAPKIAACEVISRLEPVGRGYYCGAIGWVDADRRMGDLNVAIRTFWIEDNMLHFGTGGGITWDSDPSAEWEETELKARRLLSVAAGRSDHLVPSPAQPNGLIS